MTFRGREVLRSTNERAERDAKVKRAEPRSFGGGTDPFRFLEGPGWKQPKAMEESREGQRPATERGGTADDQSSNAAFALKTTPTRRVLTDAPFGRVESSVDSML